MATKYSAAVKQAAALLKRGDAANWELARLTYENTGPGKKTLESWAADVCKIAHRPFSRPTASKFRQMWMHRLEKTHKCALSSWTECWYLLHPRDQGPPARTRSARLHVAEATPDEVAETVAKALQRPAVARRVFANPDVTRPLVADAKVNLSLAKARQAHDQEFANLAELGSPRLRNARIKTRYAILLSLLVAVRNELLAWGRETGTWEPNGYEEALDYIEQLVMAAEGLRSALTFEAGMKELMK